MPIKSVRGNCHLCGKERELIGSHIIPKFMYKGLKKKERRFYLISSDSSKKEIIKQNGIWEHLLCAKCDNEILQPYESYTSQFIYGGAKIESAKEGNNLIIRKIDYKKLKLCLLSILWRMSISKHEYFNEVELGEEHNTKIKNMILNDNPGAFLDYPISVTAPVFDGKFLGDWTLKPDFIRVYGHRVYRCLIGGMLFCFWISSKEYEKKTHPIFLNENGSLIIFRKKIEKIPFLYDACIKLGKAALSRRSGWAENQNAI